MERCRSSVGHSAIFIDRLSPSVAAKLHTTSGCGAISVFIDVPNAGFFPDDWILEAAIWCARASYPVWTLVHHLNDYNMIPFRVPHLA